MDDSDVRALHERAQAGGAPKYHQKNAEQGKLFARERIARLTDAVLLLGYFEGLSSSEIAERIGVPLGTVKSRVAAALSALRSALSDPVVPLR